MLVLRVSLVTIRRITTHKLTLSGRRSFHLSDLLRYIAWIPFIQHILEGSDIIIFLTISIEAVIDRDEANTIINEEFLGVITNLRVVAA